MFVTSTSEVAGPGISNLLFPVFDQILDPTQILCVETVVPGQLDSGLDPELCLTVGRLNVDVYACLLT